MRRTNMVKLQLQDIVDVKKITNLCDLVGVKPLTNNSGEITKIIMEFVPTGAEDLTLPTLGFSEDFEKCKSSEDRKLKGVFKK